VESAIMNTAYRHVHREAGSNTEIYKEREATKKILDPSLVLFTYAVLAF